jgi:hypothetical protein
MRTSFRHQSEAQPPNGPLTAATSPDTPSTCPATQSGLFNAFMCAAGAVRSVAEGPQAGSEGRFHGSPSRAGVTARRSVAEPRNS